MFDLYAPSHARAGLTFARSSLPPTPPAPSARAGWAGVAAAAAVAAAVFVWTRSHAAPAAATQAIAAHSTAWAVGGGTKAAGR